MGLILVSCPFTETIFGSRRIDLHNRSDKDMLPVRILGDGLLRWIKVVFANSTGTSNATTKINLLGHNGSMNQ